jgi:uncharacterized membrane protein YeaQ/YmgE (transglycosylase-associated protein family)
MWLIELLLLGLLAAICGALALFLVGYSRGGCPGSFVAGIIGALLGPQVADRIGWIEPFTLRIAELEFPVVTRAAGALLLALLLNLVTHKRKF